MVFEMENVLVNEYSEEEIKELESRGIVCKPRKQAVYNEYWLSGNFKAEPHELGELADRLNMKFTIVYNDGGYCTTNYSI